MSQAVEEALSTAAEVMEQPLNVAAVETITLVKNNPIVLTGVALVSLAAGAAAGFFAAKKYLEPKYEKIAQEEIQEAKRFYSVLNKDGFSSPEEAVKALIPDEDAVVVALRKYKGLPENQEAEEDGDEPDIEVVVESTNVFVDNKPLDPGQWDYEVEAETRTNSYPYVIHHDEYMENEDEYEEMNLTFFAGDDILSGEDDQVVENVDELVGSMNLEKFGHGSKNKDIVYVCNPKKRVIMEIVRSKGTYMEEVAGFKHADTRSNIRKFRAGDE